MAGDTVNFVSATNTGKEYNVTGNIGANVKAAQVDLLASLTSHINCIRRLVSHKGGGDGHDAPAAFAPGSIIAMDIDGNVFYFVVKTNGDIVLKVTEDEAQQVVDAINNAEPNRSQVIVGNQLDLSILNNHLGGQVSTTDGSEFLGNSGDGQAVVNVIRAWLTLIWLLRRKPSPIPRSSRLQLRTAR